MQQGEFGFPDMERIFSQFDQAFRVNDLFEGIDFNMGGQGHGLQ